MLVPKLLLTPIKIRISGPKTAKIGPKSAFLVILGQILPLFCTFCPMPDQKNNVNRVPRWVFSMWVTKLLISPVKIRIFCPKKSKFGPKMAFLFFLGQALPAHLVGGCGARAVYRKTPIYFIFSKKMGFVRGTKSW